MLMIALCVGVPSAAWFLRGRLAPLAVLAIAYSPLIDFRASFVGRADVRIGESETALAGT